MPIGRWVLFEACRQLAEWRAAFGASLDWAISVNISARQLRTDDLLADVQLALDRHGLKPDDLMLEITESLLVEAQGAPSERLAALRASGVRLCIDDFGTGYSALAYLHRFPADVLKIDKAFIDGLDAADGRRDLTEAVVQIGQALGMRIVAEGVEREPQLARLREMGCDLAQGFLLARPMDPDGIRRLLFEEATAAALTIADPASTGGRVARPVPLVGLWGPSAT